MKLDDDKINVDLWILAAIFSTVLCASLVMDDIRRNEEPCLDFQAIAEAGVLIDLSTTEPLHQCKG